MSYELTAKVVRAILPGLTPLDQLVLIQIADMIDEKGYCFPSQTTIANKANCDRISVNLAIKKLEKLGLIMVARQQGVVSKYFIQEDILEKHAKKGKSTCKNLQQGVLSKTTGSSNVSQQGVLSETTLINKGKNNKKIKSGASSSKNAEASATSPKVGKGKEEIIGELKEKGLTISEKKFVEQGLAMMVPEKIDGVEVEPGQVVMFVDPAHINDVEELLAEETETVLDVTLPVHPDAGDIVNAEDGAIIFDGTGWQALGPHHKGLPIMAGLKVADIQANHNAGVKKPTLKKTPSMVWQESVAEWREEKGKKGANIKLTEVSKGKLNQVAKKINEAGFEYKAMIAYTVSRWGAFVNYVTKQTGKKKVYPQSPDIDYFVYHAKHVVDFWISNQSDTKCNKPKIKVTKKKLSEKEYNKLTPAQKWEYDFETKNSD